MASSSVNNNESPIILTGPENWHPWLALVRKFAKDEHIWVNINPSPTTSEGPRQALHLPQSPNPLDFYSDTARATYQQALAAHTQDPANAAAPAAPSFAGVVAANREAYKFAYEIHRDEVKVFERKSKAIRDLHKWIQTHLNKKCLSYIQDLDNVPDELAELQRKVAPTDHARERTAVGQYESVRKVSRNTRIEDWLDLWDEALKEGIRLSIPDVQGTRPVYHFIEAVRPFNPGFYQSWFNTIEAALLSGQPLQVDGFRIAEIFRTQARMTKNINTFSKATFAIFQGQPDQSAGSPKASSGQSSQQRGQKEPPKCPCGELHYLGDCPYAVESARAKGWKPDAKVEAEFNKQMKESTYLQKILKRVRNKEKKADQPAKSDSKADSKSDSDSVHPSGAFASTPPETTSSSAPSTPASPPASTASTSASAATSTYPLHDSFIYDSGSNIHICNHRDRFTRYEAYPHPKLIWAGGNQLPILGTGDVPMEITTPDGHTKKFILFNTAHVPDFHVNVVSARRLKKAGIYWDMENNTLQFNGKAFAQLSDKYGQFVLEYNEPKATFTANHPTESTAPESTAPDSTAPESTVSELKPPSRTSQHLTGHLWHLRMGHLGQEALERLVKCTTDARIHGPTTIECEDCSRAKATNVINHDPPKRTSPRPFWRVHFDIFEHITSYNNYNYALVFKDEYTGLIFIYFLHDKSQSSVLDAVQDFAAWVRRQYDLEVQFYQSDNERALGNEWAEWISKEGAGHRTAPVYTKEPNGPAERSGGVLKFKSIAMRLAPRLPADLWPEIWGTAAYLHKRSPRQFVDENNKTQWKSPFEVLNEWLRNHGRSVAGPNNPDVDHTKAYGCKAYPLTHEVKANEERRLAKTEPRAHIGYLVGYDGTNIYRIWVPEIGQVIRTRDVKFDEQSFYNPDEDTSAVSIQQLRTHAEEIRLPEDDEESIAESTIYVGGMPESEDIPEDTTEADPPDTAPPDTADPGEQLPTPDPSPSPDAYRSAFHAGTHHRLHRRDLPPEPRNWKEAQSHQFRDQWMTAANIEWQAISTNGTCKSVPIDTVTGQILPLAWVFRYKLDKHGFVIKFKARICVRGDLQANNQLDTYAATLAGKSFRSIIAIAAKWDLQLQQYDAVNAFTNSPLDETVHVHFPDGFKRFGWCILLLRALYGLRRSPLLWQKDLSTTLKALGLTQGTEEPCVFYNSWLLVFFYVDDLVLAYRSEDEPRKQDFQRQLFQKYEMHDLGDLKWFLGIRVLRDRSLRKIWLVQDSYIERIATTFHLTEPAGSKWPKTPLPAEPLVRFEGTASDAQKHLFQRKNGSVIYSAVITRPDISFAASKLAEFMSNPSPRHMEVIDQTIRYLYNTRYLALEYDGTSNLELFVAGDASYADNADRKSTQGFIITLFGGPIAWKSGKQSIITGSTTEAELVSLTNTTKESMELLRILRDLQLKLSEPLQVYCDNKQALRLVTSELQRIKTAMKHVDVPKLWLRQEYRRGTVKTVYIPTAQMPADGFTKALTRQKQEEFVRQLGLTDVQSVIEAQEALED